MISNWSPIKGQTDLPVKVEKIVEPGIGTRASQKLQELTGKKPCGGCKKIAAAIDKFFKL